MMPFAPAEQAVAFVDPGVLRDHLPRFGQAIAGHRDGQDDEEIDGSKTYTFHHPFVDYRNFTLKCPGDVVPLLVPYMKEGKLIRKLPALQEIQTVTRSNLQALDGTFKRIINPHIYRVSISDSVKRTKETILKRYLGNDV